VKWHARFMGDSAILEILNFPQHQIEVAVRRNVKLKEILNDLVNQEIARDEFKRKLNPYFESFEDRGLPDKPQISQNWVRWGGRWRRQF